MKTLLKILLVLALLQVSVVANETKKVEDKDEGITVTDVALSPVYAFVGLGYVLQMTVAGTIGLAVKGTKAIGNALDTSDEKQEPKSTEVKSSSLKKIDEFVKGDQ